jgi:hypothetical protein
VGDVADLLGRCSLGCNHRGKLYTSSYKQCLVSRMQEIRMVAFDFSIQSLSACTPLAEQFDAEPVVRPIAEQLSWYLSGTATFQTSSEEWTEQAVVIAYRDQGEWYFTPPQSAMQDKWKKSITPRQISLGIAETKSAFQIPRPLQSKSPTCMRT